MIATRKAIATRRARLTCRRRSRHGAAEATPAFWRRSASTAYRRKNVIYRASGVLIRR